MATTDKLPEAAQKTALAHGFAVLRIDPGHEDSPKFLAMGTWMGLGANIVATSAFRLPNINHNRALENIFVQHMATGKRARIEWGVEGLINGLVYLSAAENFGPDPKPVGIADHDDYDRLDLAMPTYTGTFLDREVDLARPGVRNGYFLHTPVYTDDWERETDILKEMEAERRDERRLSRAVARLLRSLDSAETIAKFLGPLDRWLRRGSILNGEAKVRAQDRFKRRVALLMARQSLQAPVEDLVQQRLRRERAKKKWLLGAASLSYPNFLDAGAPVMTVDGRLLGILVGPRDYHELRNQGLYTPADLAMAYGRFAERKWNGSKGRNRGSLGTAWASYSYED